MTDNLNDEPLTGETVKRVFEMFGQALIKAMSATPADRSEVLRTLAAELRGSAVAMEGVSDDTARALHLTAEKIDAAVAGLSVDQSGQASIH